MVVDAPTAQRFIQAYKAVLGSLISDEDKAGKDVTEWLTLGRDCYGADRSLLARYRAAHPQADSEMLDAMAHMLLDRWVHLKDTRTYSVVLDIDAEGAYAVLGLTQALATISAGDGRGLGSGLVMEAALVPLNGHWVCDGLIKNPVWLGANYRRSYTASYQALRKSGQFSAGPLERNHTKAFWALATRHMPGWRLQHEALERALFGDAV